MPPMPEVPLAAHAEVDSMLARKFGREIANYFSSSPINRVSFLRNDHTFLSSALNHPTTKLLLFKNLCPLVKDSHELQYVDLSDIKSLVPEDPFLATEADQIKAYNSAVTIPTLVFLGIDEKKTDGLSYNGHTGAPVFALDVTPKGSIEAEAKKLCDDFEAKGLQWLEGRVHMAFPAPEAAIYAQARAKLDWNARNPFCGQCGQSTLSVNAGTKRVCPSTDSNPDANPTRAACLTRTTLSNLSFPRTDPTIIVGVISHDGKRILLGRQKRWPKYWYSTLAGFIEPGESVEEAVRREVWEESGVLLGRVVIHSTQPWPYPANLMIGCVAQTVSGGDGEKIKLDNDPELEDAKWFPLEEVKEALRVGTSGLDEGPGNKEYKEGGLRLPPRTAIANQLISSVVGDGFLGGVTKI